ncbi:MAG TPA: HNH endonuclease signature motif containing protein [Gaiellaceae bacterium]
MRAGMINNALGSPCPLCSRPLLPHERLHLDHVVALSWGGSDHPANLQVVHQRCNLRKGRGEAPVWAAYR